jgi:hypothetical protein
VAKCRRAGHCDVCARLNGGAVGNSSGEGEDGVVRPVCRGVCGCSSVSPPCLTSRYALAVLTMQAIDIAPYFRAIVQITAALKAQKIKVTLIKLADFWRSGGQAQKRCRQTAEGGGGVVARSPFSKADSERIIAKLIVDSEFCSAAR